MSELFAIALALPFIAVYLFLIRLLFGLFSDSSKSPKYPAWRIYLRIAVWSVVLLVLFLLMWPSPPRGK